MKIYWTYSRTDLKPDQILAHEKAKARMSNDKYHIGGLDRITPIFTHCITKEGYLHAINYCPGTEVHLALIGGLDNDFDLYHVDFSKIRTNKNQDKFFYSNDWKAYNQHPEKTGFKEIEKFDPQSKKSGIFYYKQYRPNQGVYPLPGYIAALRYIEIEKEIANFHLNNIKNGFVGGTLISFNNGQPTLEEQKEIERQIKNKHTGTDNAGGIVLVFSEGKDKEPTVLPLRSNDLF